MKTPEPGEWFISKTGHLCRMEGGESYTVFIPFGKCRNMWYIEGSAEYSKLRDAREEEISCGHACGTPTSDTKGNIMNNEFNVVLEEGHDTTRGLKELEAQYIEHIYAISKYNQVRAAKNLGISRGCLRMKLKEYFGGKYL